MSPSPLTDWFDAHTTALLGRDVTKTYNDCAPAATTFAAAWDSGEPKDRLTMLADRYVSINELRPAWFKEITLGAPETCADIVLPIGTKLGGFGHTYWLVSVLTDIATRVGGKIASRARSLAASILFGYYAQDNSYLKLANKSYGQTGRARCAGLIVRALADAHEAWDDAPMRSQVIAYLSSHIQNIAAQNMCCGPQGDGLTIPHWRVFQVAILMAALERAKAVVGIDTTPLVDRFLPIVEASVSRNVEGKPNGSFWYDVPEPITTPQPWTNLPGWKLGNGNGVELWLYRYLPADAQAAIRAANPKLPVAVARKYGIA